jgi:hypothetical protein
MNPLLLVALMRYALWGKDVRINESVGFTQKVMQARSGARGEQALCERQDVSASMRGRKGMKKRSGIVESMDAPEAVGWGAPGTGIGLAILFLAVMVAVYGLISITAQGMIIVVLAAIALFWKGIGGVAAMRWWARIVGIGETVLLSLILISSSVGVHKPGLLAFAEWAAVLIGIILAFFWEGIGGVIVTLAALAIQADVIMHVGKELNSFLLTLVFVGLTLIYCWWRTRRLSLRQQPA